MKISPGGGDGGVAECRLDQVDGRPAVEGMGGVGVAQPVRGDGEIDAGAAGGLPDDAQHGHSLKSGAMFARAEDRILLLGSRTKRGQKLGDRFGELDGSGLGAFAPDGDLGSVAVWLDVAPAKAADFADPDAGGVEQQQESTVAGIRLQAEHPVDVGLRQDPLGQAVADRRQAKGAADIEGEIADAVAEGEQRFDGGERAVTARRGQTKQGIGEALQIGEAHQPQRLPCPGPEPLDVGAVGALGVDRAAMQPNFNELVVRVSTGRIWESFDRAGNREFGAHGGQDITKARYVRYDGLSCIHLTWDGPTPRRAWGRKEHFSGGNLKAYSTPSGLRLE